MTFVVVAAAALDVDDMALHNMDTVVIVDDDAAVVTWEEDMA